MKVRFGLALALVACFSQPLSASEYSASDRASLYKKYKEILTKVETHPVSIREAKKAGNYLVTFICTDESFQKDGASTVNKCMKQYKNKKRQCEKSVFSNQALFNEKKKLVEKMGQFAQCININL